MTPIPAQELSFKEFVVEAQENISQKAKKIKKKKKKKVPEPIQHEIETIRESLISHNLAPKNKQIPYDNHKMTSDSDVCTIK